MDTKKLRQKILDLAIHGKLVPQDPNDEPASVLLERIRAEKERLIKEGKIKKSKASKTSDTPHYEQMPFEVPSSWEWTTLGAISNYGENKNVQIENIEAEEWILELEDIEKDSAKIIQYLSKNERKINGTRHKFCKGEILYSKLRTYLNKVLIAPNNGYCTTEIMPFVTFGLSNEYVCHVLRSPYFLDYTQQCGYGVKMPRLSTTDACNGMIPLPPLAEQYRIISEIEKWFAFIDIIESGKTDLQTTIKQTKSKILDLAIHGKLVPQDPNDEPASELLKRINPAAEITCDNGHYQNLPNGWTKCKLSDLCKIENGFAFSSIDYKTEGTPLVRISNLVNNSIDLTECVYIQNKTEDKFIVAKGDLLIAMSGATTGKMGVYTHEKTSYLNQRVGNIKILEDSLLLPRYRDIYMQSKVDDVLKLAYGGAQPNISASVISNFDFLLPPVDEQKRIVKAINITFKYLDTIMESL